MTAMGVRSTILVTGGAGFIGSNFIQAWLAAESASVVNLDKLTYAANPANLRSVEGSPRYRFEQGDIGDVARVEKLLKQYQPKAIVHFAAESHVDRSIHGPEAFIQTNMVGTFRLLEAVRQYWADLSPPLRQSFRFVHVSTDEVYGSLSPADSPFTEHSQYAPNSPYSASKAGSDHLVRSYHHTYGLPTVTINCSNNYGAFQFPEKLIPLIILNALAHKPLPVYGDGLNVRDWLYVGDHCAGIRLALSKGRPGETYNLGGNNERTNIDVVRTICRILDELHPNAGGKPYESLIAFVADRPGHDRRYAIDAAKSRKELGWQANETFETGIRKTVRWYLENRDWTQAVVSGEYRNWIEKNYAGRETT